MNRIYYGMACAMCGLLVPLPIILNVVHGGIWALLSIPMLMATIFVVGSGMDDK